MIDKFSGEWAFLSNFYPCTIIDEDGLRYGSVEAAFQAAKTLDPVEKLKFTELGPGEAKRLGRKVKLREDWEKVKLGVMEELLRQKFDKEELYGRLVDDTWPHELVEGNHWGDTYWGVCRGEGENHLGKLLMKLRAERREDDYLND